MPGSLKGRVALITGAGSGIGRAAARAFAREGAIVVVSDIRPEAGEETVRWIRNTGADAEFIRADVTRASEVEALIGQTLETRGRLDCAFNNAGTFGPSGLVADFTETDWDRVLDINLKGVWLCLKHEIPAMLEQGGGTIVNNASTSGLVGSKSSPVYAASKHGVVGLTRTAALQYAEKNIRINAVCPGAIRTPMLEDIFTHKPDNEARYIAAEPIGRLGTAEEVAEAVVWLCSDAASFIIGHALPVDGGWTAQ